MTERDALIVLSQELPKLAAAVKGLRHPMLELLIDQAQSELEKLKVDRRTAGNGGIRPDEGVLGALPQIG